MLESPIYVSRVEMTKNTLCWSNFDQVNQWSYEVKKSFKLQNPSFYIKINIFNHFSHV